MLYQKSNKLLRKYVFLNMPDQNVAWIKHCKIEIPSRKLIFSSVLGLDQTIINFSLKQEKIQKKKNKRKLHDNILDGN